MSVANRLLESSHYASQQIKQIANQLDLEWKAFAAALDERSTLLDMSAVFHQKAEQVSNCSLLSRSVLTGLGRESQFLLPHALPNLLSIYCGFSYTFLESVGFFEFQ